jgi:hypothetical protein
MDTFTPAVDVTSLCFDEYGLRAVGRTLDYKPELMPIFRHICICKEWLIREFVYVRMNELDQ